MAMSEVRGKCRRYIQIEKNNRSGLLFLLLVPPCDSQVYNICLEEQELDSRDHQIQVGLSSSSKSVVTNYPCQSSFRSWILISFKSSLMKNDRNNQERVGSSTWKMHGIGVSARAFYTVACELFKRFR